MDGFLKFFFAFMSRLLKGFGTIFKGLFGGIKEIFDFKGYIQLFKGFSAEFSVTGWVLSILSVLVVIAIFALLIFLIALVIRKYIRFRHSVVGQEDLLEELADLHREVIKLTDEKDKIMAMKVSQLGLHPEESPYLQEEEADPGKALEGKNPIEVEGTPVEEGESRFFRLSEIDRRYIEYVPPVYEEEITLEEFCDRFRNFACSRMRLFYDHKTIRLFVAGMASTRLILLQGISGTGKTSLPYAFGKFLQRDSTIASVQPSWRDRTELFGYFNEFTKKFNETEVLRRIYESSFNEDINIIVLDEMNIARVEYYFAEMLSILEMPNPEEWKLDIVPDSWPNDPLHLQHGQLKIPQNLWYVGTANNDDSTFAVSDKVYDRAQPINLDSKGVAFDAPDTPPVHVNYQHLLDLFRKAIETYPISKENLDKVAKLDIWVIEKLRIAFGNRILKQMRDFVPVYVACGGTELDGIDYVLATKIFRKFESLNLTMYREELGALVTFLSRSFGKDQMLESKAYLERLQKYF